ncbi:MAG: hypothetical protein DRO76_00570 [Candidatus Altiarchaeales archaeon]|nr:MAG: hypothetical protein DRO76_00570 [Candidatus Altiarchaeales archaeon]
MPSIKSFCDFTRFSFSHILASVSFFTHPMVGSIIYCILSIR